MNRLLGGNGPFKLLSFPGVFHRRFHGSLRNAQGLGGHTDPTVVQGRQANLHAVAEFAQKVCFRYATVFKKQGRNGVGAHAAKVFQFAAQKTRKFTFNNKDRALQFIFRQRRQCEN